tara:strand:+ start:41 stop:643 length:603 start_codon:yes stop_codon:yes gene_type:complete
MVYEKLTEFLRQNFYIILSERFQSDSSSIVLERYMAKHHLLKPELIVVNDQPHGFKQASKRIKTLEKFPIFIEIEYSQISDTEKYVENVEIYAESQVKFDDYLDEIKYLGNVFSKTLMIEATVPLSPKSDNTLFVYSKVSDLFLEEYLEQDLEEGLINVSDIESMIDNYLTSFIHSIKLLDDVIVHQQPLKKIDQVFDTK